MGFLNPIALLLGAAIAVPLILHLFQRQQGPRVIFPALRYLRRAEKEHARRIKLRQLLLLLLRISVLVLLAAAAARPFLRSGGASHEPTAVVIVLDNSASSGAVAQDRRVLDVLKERAQESLFRAGPDDVFWLLRAGSPWEPATRGDAAFIADRVRETQPTGSAANLSAALDRAAGLLETGAGARAKEIHLLSDLQATNLRAGERARGMPPVIVWEPTGTPPSNRGVVDVEIGGGLVPRAGERSSLAVRLAGNRDGDTANIRATVDGRVTAAGTGSTGSSAVLSLPPQRAGTISGWVDVDADALRADDRRYFAAQVTPLPKVALTRATPFVEEALAVMMEAGRIQREALPSATVVLAPGGTNLPAAPAGASVVVTPPETPLELPALNRSLATAGIPWRYEQPNVAGEVGFAADANADDPFLRQLAGVRVRRTYPLRSARTAGDSVVLRLADGSPFAIRGERPGGGFYLLLASPLSDSSTTLPTSAAMLPLLDRMTGAWIASSVASFEVQPGEALALARAATGVQRPDGGRDSVSVDEPYRPPPVPGVYRVLARDSLIDAFVINLPPLESDLRRVTSARLKSALPGWDLELADSPAEWARDIYRHRLGREVWGPVLWLLLLLLVVESLAAASGRSAGRQTSSPARAPADLPA